MNAIPVIRFARLFGLIAFLSLAQPYRGHTSNLCSAGYSAVGPEGQALPAPGSVVFSTHEDGYLDFARHFTGPGYRVHDYSSTPYPKQDPHPYPGEMTPSGEFHRNIFLESYRKAMDFGAENGGINLIVTSINPKDIARLRGAAGKLMRAREEKIANTDPKREKELETKLLGAFIGFSDFGDYSYTDWEFARSLDLYPNKVVLWRKAGNRWLRLNPQETTDMMKSFAPID